MANIYDKVPVKVQKKSTFDKSHKNLFSSKVGTITPVMCDELIPNSTVNLKIAMTTQLPPLASDTFMNVKQKYAAFFVPTRILVKGYEQWLCEQGRATVGGTDSDSRVTLPTYSFDIETQDLEQLKPGTLADYLGFKITSYDGSGLSDVSEFKLSALPFLAYHHIWNEWFRNSLVQKDIFNNAGGTVYSVANSKNITPYGIDYSFKAGSSIVGAVCSDMFVDGKHLYDLRQANFGSDIYTSCTPSPQNGNGQSVSFTVTNDKGNFTISALRAANAMQQFLERNNLAGNRLVDYVKAQYGANLNDAIAQRPILLGSGSFDVYSKGIYQTNSNFLEGSSVQTQNPFGATATKFGSAYVDGNDFIIKGFTAQEPGYLMVVTWLSPKASYSTGVAPILNRYLTVSSQSDMANPILQGVGDEPIKVSQLSGRQALLKDSAGHTDAVFGYNQRYANWKDMQDEVHGILRDGSSLQSFCLQKTFGIGSSTGVETQAELSSDFLEIPTTYLNQVSAVADDISSYGYWTDCYLDYKVSMPLARYSIPTLEDVGSEHGSDIVIDKGGKTIA